MSEIGGRDLRARSCVSGLEPGYTDTNANYSRTSSNDSQTQSSSRTDAILTDSKVCIYLVFNVGKFIFNFFKTYCFRQIYWHY